MLFSKCKLKKKNQFKIFLILKSIYENTDFYLKFFICYETNKEKTHKILIEL